MEGVLKDIGRERCRQQEEEGWTAEHDDGQELGEMAAAAGCYALQATENYEGAAGRVPDEWPWDAEWWKPRDRRRDLIRAAALIVAEVERLDRAAKGRT